MSANVFIMRAPSPGLTCRGGVFAYPSQLHPYNPEPPSGGGGSNIYHRGPLGLPGCRPHETYRECRKRKDEEALIVLGII